MRYNPPLGSLCILILILTGCAINQKSKTLDIHDVNKEIERCEAFKEHVEETSYEDCLLNAKLSEGVYTVPTIKAKDEKIGEELEFFQIDRKLLDVDERFENLTPEFFMKDNILNNVCTWHLDAWQKMKKCNFSIQCQTNAYLYFEKWCLREIAWKTGDINWCDKFKLSNMNRDCKIGIATTYKNTSICFSFTGDIGAKECFESLANQDKDPKYCCMIRDWCVSRFRELGKNESFCDEDLIKGYIWDCMFKKAGRLINCNPIPRYKDDNEYGIEAKKRLNGSIMEKIVFGNTSIEDCEYIQDTENSIYNRQDDFVNPSTITHACLAKVKDCTTLGTWGVPFEYCNYYKKFNNFDECQGRMLITTCRRIVAIKNQRKPPQSDDKVYMFEWDIINANIDDCQYLTDAQRRECLATIGSLWLDCDACYKLEELDKDSGESCKNAIAIYSNRTILCNKKN